MPYLFGPPCAPPLSSVSWYAGSLNVPFNAPVPSFLGFFPAVFDDVLRDDAKFDTLFDELRRHVERCRGARLPLLVVFACHPERLCYHGPLEVWRYGNGQNRDRAAVPPGIEARHSRAEVERALGNFRRLVRYLRDAPDVVPTTIGELTRRYGRQAETIDSAGLAEIACRALDRHEIPSGESLSAAESLVGFADALVRWSEADRLPTSITRRDVLGPLQAPPLAPEVPRLNLAQLIAVARDLLEHVARTGHLPSHVERDGQAHGLGVLYGALATAYRQAWTGTVFSASGADAVSLEVWPRYPAFAGLLSDWKRLSVEDPLIRPGLSTEAAALQARLQTWTLKPASE
jgi:hypothetical protein